MSDEIDLIFLAPGIGMDVNPPNNIYVRPGDIIENMHLEDTQVNRLAVFQAVNDGYAKEGTQVILVADDDQPSGEASELSTETNIDDEDSDPTDYTTWSQTQTIHNGVN